EFCWPDHFLIILRHAINVRARDALNRISPSFPRVIKITPIVRPFHDTNDAFNYNSRDHRRQQPNQYPSNVGESVHWTKGAALPDMRLLVAIQIAAGRLAQVTHYRALCECVRWVVSQPESALVTMGVFSHLVAVFAPPDVDKV